MLRGKKSLIPLAALLGIGVCVVGLAFSIRDSSLPFTSPDCAGSTVCKDFKSTQTLALMDSFRAMTSADQQATCVSMSKDPHGFAQALASNVTDQALFNKGFTRDEYINFVGIAIIGECGRVK